ncbi:MAG: DUF4249 domain-containing protein [Bacteroidia bacterium]|nr:DUF4249 domain-containing protein [Bacteroidia bacterium]
MIKYLLFFLPFTILLTSCVKDIEVDVPEYSEKLCVDGRIEQGQTAWVVLTRNAAFFGDYDLNNLLNYIVTDAFVTVSNGVTTDTLTHFMYGLYAGSTITGQVGTTYTLNISWNNKVYTSTTTIPGPVPLDSLWFKVQGTMDSLGYVWANFQEPQGTGNAYRWFAKRLNKDQDFIAPFGSAFEDKFIDGQDFDFAYNRGQLPDSDAPDDNNEEAYYFKKDDTIVVKFTSIDDPSYQFWRSYETQVLSGGNPFAAPGNVKSNILPKGEALGVFCGYGVFLDTLITNVP